MKGRAGITVAFLAVVILAIPSQGFPLSVRQYESKTKQQRADFVAKEIDKIISDVSRVNPPLSKAIHEYFYIIPEGQPESPGLIAFEGALAAVEHSGDQGKLDLNKVQIEGILFGIIKRDVLKQNPKSKQPPDKQ